MTSTKTLLRRPRLSPLRYPGGKQLLAPYVAGVIEENFLNGCVFYEPFAGGASVSLELLRLGYVDRAVLIERDPLIYCFWWAVCNKLDELCAAVEETPVTIDTWIQLQPTRAVLDPDQSCYSKLQLGMAAFFFNRTNFSGVLGAGPIGGMSQASSYKIDCRFNKRALVESLRALSPFSSRLEIEFADSIKWLEENKQPLSQPGVFIYVDPPYYGQGKKLYRHSFSNDQHIALAKLLKDAKYPWLLSYDDASFIRDLYSSKNQQAIYLDHRVKSSRLAQEIVISNLEIPPPVYEGFSIADLHRPGTVVGCKEIV